MGAKLYILFGPQEEKEYLIGKEVVVVGRWDREQNWYPDIDLHPDKRVSRRHLQIWREQGHYWVKDLGSKHGTLVNGEEVKGKNERVLHEYARICIGDTILTFEPGNCLNVEDKGLIVHFELQEVINFALVHCGFPIISNLWMHNSSGSDLAPRCLCFSLQRYSGERVVKSPLLSSNKSICLGDVYVELDDLRLEGNIEKVKTQFMLRIDEKLVLQREVSILAYNEFSLGEQSEHQVSLAAFVQPSHPAVQAIVRKASVHLRKHTGKNSFEAIRNSHAPDRFKKIAMAIYECLSREYEIFYEKELSYSSVQRTQKVRLAHQIFGDARSQKGTGTCIDLAILFVACLESAGVRPVILLVKGSDLCAHAVAGCWQRDDAENTDPLLVDKEQLLKMMRSGELVLIECTGFTRGTEHLEFEGAIEQACRTVYGSDFLFALDILAARKYGGKEGISPFPFVGSLPYSVDVNAILSRAENYALETRCKVLGIPHLFLALLEVKDGTMQRILRAQRKDPDEVAEKIKKCIEGDVAIRDKPTPTCHYEEAIKVADIIARRRNSGLIQEPDLVEALLEVHSEAFEKMLELSSTTRQECVRLFYKLTGLRRSSGSSTFFSEKS